MAAVLWVGEQQFAPTTLVEVAAHFAVGGVVYSALFVGVAISGAERRFYWTKLRGLVSPQRRSAAAV